MIDTIETLWLDIAKYQPLRDGSYIPLPVKLQSKTVIVNPQNKDDDCLAWVILYVPETGILFLGCGSISARVSTREIKLIDIDNVCLFWSLSRHKEYVLETGELECFLYSLSGEKVSSTAVDPPYEMEVTDNGIKFESIVLGSTWLRYESNG